MITYHMDFVLFGMAGDRDNCVLSAPVFANCGTDEDGDYESTFLAEEIAEKSADAIFEKHMPQILDHFFPGGLERRITVPCIVYYEIDIGIGEIVITGWYALSDIGIDRMKAAAMEP